jgi:CRP-like cAMP-binding protein
MNSIIEIFKGDEDVLKVINANLVTKKLAKGTVLQTKGEPHSNLYFVKKGILRSYSIDAKDKEHIFMFAPEGWILSELESQLNNKPNKLYVDVVEDCEVEIVLAKDIPPQFMLENVFNHLGNTRLMKRLNVLQHRVIMLMSASAQERYEEFLDTYPNIVQRVPQKMIASYLGVTPEALSKIRGQIAKAK